MSFLDEVAEERWRQIDELGYDADHDDGHDGGEIAQAAAALALEPGHGRDRADLWPWEATVPRSFTEAGDRRAELVKAAAMLHAEADRLDRVGLPPQAYLPRGYCWNGRPVQVAASVRDEAVAFLHRHPRLKAFSGLRRGSAGDHRCGFALDMVPESYDDFAAVDLAHADAVHSGYAYVEPLADTWLRGNHHLHVSFVRCP